MRILNKAVESCIDCPCESMTKGIDARVFCNYESKENPRSILVMSTIEKAREKMYSNCKLKSMDRCYRCLGSGKYFCDKEKHDVTCEICLGRGVL